MPVDRPTTPRRLWLSLEPHGGGPGATPGLTAEPPAAIPPGAVEVTQDRFVIGRGQHCDLVVDSRVGREHAAVTRDGPDFYIEDLRSTAGTWHMRKRLSGRRKIEDGDVYELNAQVPVRCFLR